MKFSVFTASTPEWTPPEAAGALAAQGWDGIEWRITDQKPADPPGFWAGNRATWPLTGLAERVPEIARVTADAGLAFSAVGGYAGAGDHDAVEQMLAATARLGAARVRVTTPRLDPDRDYRDVFSALRTDVAWVADRAAAHGVKALIELHHGTLVASASAAVRLLDGLDPVAVGVIHDLGNLLIEGHEDHLSAFQMLGPYLAHVHVKNGGWWPAETTADGTVRWVHRFAPLRTGQADVGDYLHTLRRHGYDGWVCVEDFSSEQPLAQRTADNLAYLRSLVDG